MRELYVGVSLLTLAAACPAYAQAIENQQATTVLKEIVIRNGLTDSPLRKSGRSVTVITAEELESQNIQYVSDALRSVPGFAVSRSGSYGSLTQVRVRGAEGNHLLVMIDGVEVNDPDSGEFDFSSLATYDIDRIEIIRGPQTTFAGSNAMAGVVNIVTKSGVSGKSTSSAQTEFGSNGRKMGALSTRGGSQGIRYAFSATAQDTDGINIAESGDEKDGNRNTTLNGKVSLDLFESTTLDGSLRHVRAYNDIDAGDPPADSDHFSKNRETYGALTLTNRALDDQLTQKLLLSASDIYRFTHGQYGDGWQDSNRYRAGYQATYTFDQSDAIKHAFTLGTDWKREVHNTERYSSAFSRNTTSILGEYKGEYFDQLFINLGARHDWNDAFKDAATWTTSAAWAIPDSQLRLHASAGTAVTNPTFTEQFGYTPSGFNANPSIRPERSLGWDVGAEVQLSDELSIDLTYFNQNLKDEIYTDYTASMSLNRDGLTKRQGVEISAKLDLDNGITLGGSYTYTDASVQKTAGGTRERAKRRPEHSGSLDASYVFYDNRARIFAEAIFNGKMDDTGYVGWSSFDVTLKNYTLVNIGGSFKFSDQIEGYARIENLFDTRYTEVYGYNTPGITGFAGLKATF